MITIKIDTNHYKLRIDGHATPEESKEYREICSAASALAQSLLYSISKAKDIDTKSIMTKPVSGNYMISVFPEKQAEEEVRKRFEIYADGMELLAEAHPCSVTMIRNEARIIAKEDGI